MAEDDFEKQEQWRIDAREFLWKFWRHWETWVISILGGSVCLILQFRGVLTTISAPIIWGIAMLGVIISAFKTWRGEKRAHEAIQRANSVETKALNNQIEEMQTKLNQRAERKVNKHVLGVYLDNLESRIRTIEKTDSNEYMSKWENEKDVESMKLIDDIGAFISKNVGVGEAAAFTSLAGIQLTSRNGAPQIVTSVFDQYTRKRVENDSKKLHMIEHLDHWAKQLKQLINNYHID